MKRGRIRRRGIWRRRSSRRAGTLRSGLRPSLRTPARKPSNHEPLLSWQLDQRLGACHNGHAVTNTYDALLRRTAVSAQYSTIPLLQHSYTHDSAGRLATAADGAYFAAYSYLANGPLVSEITFKSNTTVRLTTTKSYDYLNRLTSVNSVGTGTNPAVTSHGYAYNDANQRTRAGLPDGSFWLYEYDALGQVKSGKRY